MKSIIAEYNSRKNYYKGSKKLIITADDFGITKSISNGIIDCLNRKLITDVSIMPCGEYFEEAANLLLKNGIRSAGVHLTAIDGEFSLSDREHVDCLVQASGEFFINRRKIMLRSLLNSKVRKQLRNEFSLQINAVIKKGLSISSINSHQHLHLFPTITPIVLELAEEFKVPFIRLPKAKRFALYAPVVNIFSSLMKSRINHSSVQMINAYGMELSGRINEVNLRDLLNGLDGNISELIVHPGFNDEYSLSKYYHWKFNWQEEMRVLGTDSWHQALKDSKVNLVSFSDLL